MENNTAAKAEYLQLIQEPICRMSTTSAIFKGFAATIVAGIVLVQYDTINKVVLILSFFPVLSFCFLDIYYLILERKYRFLYDQVQEGNHDIDYSIKLIKDKKEIRIDKARIIDCILSPSIYLFYPLMIGILVTICILKCCNII